MKPKQFVLLFLIFLVVGLPCSGSISNAQTMDTRFLRDPVMYCPTRNPEAQDFFRNGVQLVQQGNVEEAIKAYTRAIELDGNFCDAMDNLGQLLRRKGKIDEAIHWYKRSIELFPKNSIAHLNLAVAYSFQGKFGEAIAEHKINIGIDPENPEGYYGLGNCVY